MVVNPARIEIHIEELVLDGVAPADRRAVADALQSELQTLVARHGAATLLSRPAGAQDAAGRIALAGGESAASLGAQVAGAIHRGWR